LKSKEVKFMFLSQEDVIKAGALDMKRCLEVVEEGFVLLSKGDCLAGGPGEHEHGCRVWFPKEARGKNMPTLGPDRRFMAMVGYLGGRFNACGTKWYGSNIENREKGLPRSILLVTLNDPNTGKPLVTMDGNIISAMRTGAVPGIAAKYLAGKDSKALGIVGAGVISKTCLMSLSIALSNLEEIYLYDINQNNADNFCEFIKKITNVKKIYKVKNIRELSENSDVISVATSGSILPDIKNDWLKDGACLILVGGISHQEEIYLSANLVVDDWKMHCKFQEENEDRKIVEPLDNSMEDLPVAYINKLIKKGKISEDNIIELGDIITGKNKIDNSKKSMFISGGLPMEDISWAYEVYQNALEKGIGQELSLWKEPHFF